MTFFRYIIPYLKYLLILCAMALKIVDSMKLKKYYIIGFI